MANSSFTTVLPTNVTEQNGLIQFVTSTATEDENANKFVMLCLYAIIGCISFLSNSFIFLVVGLNKKLWSNSYLLLLSLAMTDWLIIVVGIPVHVVNIYYGKTITVGVWCTFYGFMIQAVFQCSMFNLALIAFHRYVLHVKHKWYQMIFGGKRIFVVLVSFAWLLPVLITSTPLYGFGRFYDDRSREHCMIDWLYNRWYIIYIQLVFPPNLVLMTFCYVRIIQKTKHRIKAIEGQNDERKKRKHKLELRSTYMLLVVLLTSTFCFSPYMVLMFVEYGSRTRPTKVLGFISMFCCYSNSMFDFIIYNIMNKRFRRCFQRILWLCAKKFGRKRKVRPLNSDMASYSKESDKNLRTVNMTSCKEYDLTGGPSL